MSTNVNDDTKKMLPNEGQSTVVTLPVKLIKNSKKQMHVMQFNNAHQVKFDDWKRARLQRENNSSLYKHRVLEDPKFGGGSTFGEAVHEEKLERQFKQKYKPENQPWTLRTKSTDEKGRTKDNKSFRGTREGGIGDNSAYYIFMTNPDGKSVSAYPVQDWYKFRPIQRYKTLSWEEAEEEFMRREKRFNYFSLMTQKRLQNKDENEYANDQPKALKESIKDLTISEMDEWITSSGDDSNSDAENRPPDNDSDKKKKKKANLKKKKKKNASDNEAFEESDDGDDEGRECEYISDSSASESELEQQKEEGLKSVAEEDGLKNLLSSDSDDDNKDEASNDKGKESHKEKLMRGDDKNGNLPDTKNKHAGGNLLNDAEYKIDGKDEAKSQKRTKSVSSDEAQVKRYKPASALSDSSYSDEASDSGISVKAVSRYLKRKPMTSVDLLKKFKSKNGNLSKQEIGQILALTLQKMKLNKRKINGVTYYSL